MKRVILLDRDGVINYDSFEYIKGVDEFIFIPGSIDAIVRLTQAGYQIGIATNQSGVSRGLYTEQDLQFMHQNMVNEIRAAGGEIAAIQYCIHLPKLGCGCRKPQPGMLHALAQYFQCTLEGIPFVGDRISDIEVALLVGATPVSIISPMTDIAELNNYPNIPVFFLIS